MATKFCKYEDDGQTKVMHQQDDRLLYLDRLHTTVDRLASQSFILKTVAVSTTGALMTIAAGMQDGRVGVLAGLALLANIMFWSLDTQFLRMERALRRMVIAVKSGQERAYFQWNIKQYIDEIGHVSVAFSWSLGWIYPALIGAIITAFVIF
jgi:hypothetical protein